MNSRSATAAPAAQRHGDAVAGRERGLVVTAKHCPAPPVASSDVAGAHARAAPSGRDARPRRRTRPCSTSEVEREPALAHLGTAIAVHRGDQRPFDLGAGGVAARVHDPGQRVAALARGSAKSPRRSARSKSRAERDQLAGHGRALRRRGRAPRRRRTGRRRRRACRRGAARASRRRDRARRPRRPARTGWPTSRARPWSAPRPTGPPRGAHRGREPGDAAAEHEDVDTESAIGERYDSVARRAELRRDRRRHGRAPIGRLRSSTCTIVRLVARRARLRRTRA